MNRAIKEVVKAKEFVADNEGNLIDGKDVVTTPTADTKGSKVLYSHIFLKEKRDQSGKLVKVK